MKRKPPVRWLNNPQAQGVVAAGSYPGLLNVPGTTARLVNKLRHSRMSEFKAKAALGVPGLSLRGISNPHVEADRLTRQLQQRSALRFAALLVLLFYAATGLAPGQQPGALPRSTPEEEGVASGDIVRFLDAAAVSGHEFHSLMILRHGKVIAEGWWAPYRPDLRHSLYSVSKSFTSTAIGFAVSDHRLSVDDRVTTFFPADLPDSISPYLAELTVRNLLCMAVGMDPEPTMSIRNSNGNWVRAILRTPILNQPGSKFLYNSLATYLLSAIVQKVTGQRVIDYLTPRLFAPLGITGMDWDVDPQGINTGGWGLRVKTEDMAKLGQLYLQKGIWNGKQILPASWVEEATTAKIDQAPGAPQSKRDSSDWMQGYCYQFWRCRHNAFRADGAYGQYIVVMPAQDAVVAITAESFDLQGELNLVWSHLLPAFRSGRFPADAEGAEALRRRLSALELPPHKAGYPSAITGSVSGRTFLLDTNSAPLKALSFSFRGDTCRLSITTETGFDSCLFGAGRWLAGSTRRRVPSPILSGIGNNGVQQNLTMGSWGWIDERTVELVLRYIESPHAETIRCRFDGTGVTVTIHASAQPVDKFLRLTGVARE